MVGRTRYRLPLSPSLARKFDALREVFDLRVLASAAAGSPTGDGTFELVPPVRARALDGPLFYALLTFRAARVLHRFRPAVAFAQSPFEGAALLLARRLAGSGARVVVELHGDWRASTRLYGSPARGLLGRLGDRVAVHAIRRADAVRALSDFTVRLAREQGVEPAAVFTTYSDLSAFTETPPAPLPERPTALFVGVLERYKNVDGLAAAWRLAAPRVPEARLCLVGRGLHVPVVERLVADLPGQTSWTPSLSAPDVVQALDESTLLLLPSRSEGTPRVIIEALARGRAVVAGRVGGIPDLVRDGVEGLLVDPDDPRGIADAVVRVLSDRALAERMGAAAAARASGWTYDAREYARRMRELAERVAG
ncbi:MAG TPA: glycosyltransferase family 4 protein [Gaiellaceae bacterium]|nr:glycosyltransferase family 4 protein [Gaiellaceae bacterium]